MHRLINKLKEKYQHTLLKTLYRLCMTLLKYFMNAILSFCHDLPRLRLQSNLLSKHSSK